MFSTQACTFSLNMYLGDVKTIFLLADDDADDQQLLTEALQRTNPQIILRAVSSVREAFVYLKNHEKELPQLLIVDYNMPDHTGAEFLDILRQHAEYDAIPVVIWSTSDSEMFKSVCEQKGALQYFKKPEQFKDLLVLSKALLQYARQ
jgi:CheY-like chemotaxis protein